ncbi:MAG: transporter substrate-binding domain-containing protein [Pseudomonadota bacterium]
MRFVLAMLAGLVPAVIPAVALADVLSAIGERGIVRLGVRDQAPPFSYTDENGAPAGLAVRLCREVAALIAPKAGQERLGLEFVRVDARQRFPALTEGRTDIHCGPASATLGRREALDFSILYFVDGAGAAVRANTYETVFDTGEGTFGYLGGTTTEAVVQDLIDRNNLRVDTREFAAHSAGLAALAAEELDVYFGDQAILLFQIEAQGLGNQIAVMEEVLSFEPYALVMKRGETRLRLAVDRALSTIYDSGLIYQIISEELGEYPLPPETRAVYQIVGLPE